MVDHGQLGTLRKTENREVPSKTLAVALFGVGDFALQFGAVVLGICDHGRGALHFFRVVVLTPLYFVYSRLVASLPVIPTEGAERSLYTLLGLLLLNTLILTMLLNLCLTVVCNSKHSNRLSSK